jgi:hypothetical protein
MSDKVRVIAKRAGMEGFDLKTFRATRATEWLRPKWLGGYGYDIQTVRDLLGHDEESESIWSYLRAVEKEVLVAEMNKKRGKGKIHHEQASYSEKSKSHRQRYGRRRRHGNALFLILTLRDSAIERVASLAVLT